jgi:catechol 2,3-dioxygenase
MDRDERSLRPEQEGGVATSVDATGTETLPATLQLGPVHLVVPDLERSIGWYRGVLGLRVHRRGPAEAGLGDGEETVLVLHQDADARPPGRHAGLYHYALLFPNRQELARAVARVAAASTPVEGASDHGTHEALYLPDADGNGIELAADRPREQWPRGFYASGPAPLDLDSLLDTIAGEAPAAEVGRGLRVGHLHLHVGDVAQGLAFYRDLIGFELMADLGTAAFLSAGGYHHHLAFNTWRGRGLGPAPEHTIGLDHWTVLLPAADVTRLRQRVEAAGLAAEPVNDGFRVRDPWQIPVEFVAEAGLAE